MMHWPPDTFGSVVVAVIVFGLIGIALVALGMKVFDWMLPGIKLDQELAGKQNLAVAIVTAAIVLAVAAVVVAALVG